MMGGVCCRMRLFDDCFGVCIALAGVSIGTFWMGWLRVALAVQRFELGFC